MHNTNKFILSKQLAKYMTNLINIAKGLTVDHSLTGVLNTSLSMNALQSDMAKIFSLRSISPLANLLIHVGKSRIIDRKLAKSQLRLYCYQDLDDFKYDDLIADSEALRYVISSKDRFFVNSNHHIRTLTVSDVSNEIYSLITSPIFIDFIKEYINKMTLYLKNVRQ